MKLVEILNKANEGYDDGFLTEYYNETTGELKDGFGDGLAKFIVVEIAETYDSEASDEDQINEAVRVLEAAKQDLDGVIDALSKG